MIGKADRRRNTAECVSTRPGFRTVGCHGRFYLGTFTLAHLPGTGRAQMLHLPEWVEDYIGPDNPVWFIDAFVERLDLAAAGFVRATANATGRAGYDPTDLLKLHICT